MDMITLVCPPGAGGSIIGHGKVDYQPDVYRADHTDRDSELHVKVPRDAAVPLLHVGGFRMAKIDSGLPSGETVRLVDKDGVLGRSFGFDGVVYEADADGVLVVPSAAAAVADAHNLEPAPPEDPRFQTDAQKADADGDAKAMHSQHEHRSDEHVAGDHKVDEPSATASGQAALDAAAAKAEQNDAKRGATGAAEHVDHPHQDATPSVGPVTTPAAPEDASNANKNKPRSATKA